MIFEKVKKGFGRFSRAQQVALTLVPILVVVIGFYETHDVDNIILLTDHGFEPNEIIISVGETVTFKTERGKYFWPASDFHPTHTAYSAFDPQEPIAPDQPWSFTFTEEGKWGFHDHIAPSYTGVITVHKGKEREFNCEESGVIHCWQQEIENAIEQNGLEGGFKVMKKLYGEDDQFAESCHYIAHNVGLIGYEEYKKDSSVILSPNAALCASGFYHGFMEGFLGRAGDVYEAAAVCDFIGEHISEELPDARNQCYHGIGHGATETILGVKGSFENEDEMIEEAISLCEKATQEKEPLYRCASGVFNTIANFYITNEYGLSVEKRNPLEICEGQEHIHKESCYGNMNSILIQAYDYNFLRAVKELLKINDTEFIDKSISYLSAQHVLSDLKGADFKQVVVDCRELPSEFQGTCIKGFAHGLIEHGAPGEEYGRAIGFCQNLELTEDEKSICFEGILGSLRGWYSEEKSQQICSFSPPEYQHFCK